MSDEKTAEVLNKISERFDIIISLFARQVLDPEKVKAKITKGTRDEARIVKCFNLCDGKTSITDIARAAKMDQGGLSRQVDSWEKDGFVFKIEDGPKTYPKALIRIP
jgi:DNA-binding MarR family transcriptional regulator